MKSNIRPLVTVAILVYKNVQYIKDCVGSVLEQDYPNIQLVICDDGSGDFDKSLVEQFVYQNNKGNIESIVVHAMEKNVGTCRNFNYALGCSKGKYVKFIAADDLFFDKDSLSKLVDAAESEKSNVVIARAPNYDMYLERKERIYPSDEHWSQMKNASNNQKKFFGIMSQYCLISAPSVLFNREFLKRMGGADERYHLIEDWPLWMRMLRMGEKFTFLDEAVVIYRSGGVSNGQNNDSYAKHQIEYADVIKYECLAYPEAFADKKQYKLAEISERKHRAEGERLLNVRPKKLSLTCLKRKSKKICDIFKPYIVEIFRKKKAIFLAGCMLLMVWNVTDFDKLLCFAISTNMALKYSMVLYYSGVIIGEFLLALGIVSYLITLPVKLWNTIKYTS